VTTWILRASFVGIGAAMLTIAACGARTGLPVPDVDAGMEDAGPDVIDAGPDVIDAGPDVADAEPDVQIEDCADAGVTFIYVVTSENELKSFYPPTAAFASIGTINCPDNTGSTPFSMGVDRKGTAYVVFTPDGELYRVSTATAACKATSFVPGQSGFDLFGMGFSTDLNGPGETLYVAESNFNGVPSKGLGAIDPATFNLTFATPFSPDLGNAVELTGTGNGRLFGLFIDTTLNQSYIAQIDKKTGAVTDTVPLPLGANTSSFAFAFWGGDFYVFHAESQGPTVVSRYSPKDGTLKDVASLPTHVVGVGVSTCAPEG
jgi:hypothetical protein